MAARDERPGVRGPRGPQGSTPKAAPARASSDLSPLQRFSLPLLTRLSRMPKWLLVMALAVLFVFGMIQSGPLAWLGALILGLLTLFFLWLLVLSWPAIPASGRLLRGIVVIALAGVTVLKAMGRL
jgi:hypothetical protein